MIMAKAVKKKEVETKGKKATPAKKATKAKGTKAAAKEKPIKAKKGKEVELSELKPKKGAGKEKKSKKSPKEDLGMFDIKFSECKQTKNKTDNWSISDLKGADYNPRTITEKGLNNLSESLLEFGDLSGVVFNRYSGNLISGHQRIETIHRGGFETQIKTKPKKDKHGTVAEGTISYKTPNGVISLPYRVVHWADKERELTANIAANAQGGVFDNRKLALMTAELQRNGDFNIGLTGLDIVTIKSLPKLDDPAGGGTSAGSSASGFKEFDSEGMDNELEHECPQCSFRFTSR